MRYVTESIIIMFAGRHFFATDSNGKYYEILKNNSLSLISLCIMYKGKLGVG
jgi:hypothetical protein